MNYDSTFCRVRQEVEFFYDMGISCKIKPSGDAHAVVRYTAARLFV